jgi:hypothetical protein
MGKACSARGYSEILHTGFKSHNLKERCDLADKDVNGIVVSL